jgi:putative tryptophan/tyrosine transport system substrate-binding protein
MWRRTMRLLVILTLAILAVPLTTVAQQEGKVYRIGCIPPGPLASRLHQWDAFRQTLHELGWVEGQNIILEFRPPVQEGDTFDELAADLVRLQVDVMVATGTPAVRAAKHATSTIPIVMSPGADPVAEGLVTSLARPGGNVTGSSIMNVDLGGKRLEILREIVPSASRVAVLWAPPYEPQLHAVRAAARALGVELLELQVIQEGDQAHNLDHAFETAKRERADAMIVIGGTLFFGLQARVAALALHHRLPAIYNLPSYVHAGGLVAYGPSDTEYYRRAAVYVDKILKGAKPGDLPVEQPMKFELLINLKVAQALGLAIPPVLLFQATEVIQ